MLYKYLDRNSVNPVIPAMPLTNPVVISIIPFLRIITMIWLHYAPTVMLRKNTENIIIKELLSIHDFLKLRDF